MSAAADDPDFAERSQRLPMVDARDHGRSHSKALPVRLAMLRYEHEYAEVELGPGDAAFIPAHTRHQVAWTTPDEPTVWLAFFWTEA